VAVSGVERISRVVREGKEEGVKEERRREREVKSDGRIVKLPPKRSRERVWSGERWEVETNDFVEGSEVRGCV
jgi:hypothetical protein